MADHPLFTLDIEGRWRLAYDRNQWILQRGEKRKSVRAGARSKGPRSDGMDWRGVSFVGSEKRILRRVIREAGVVLAAEAQARLDALPEQFLEFVAVAASNTSPATHLEADEATHIEAEAA